MMTRALAKRDESRRVAPVRNRVPYKAPDPGGKIVRGACRPPGRAGPGTLLPRRSRNVEQLEESSAPPRMRRRLGEILGLVRSHHRPMIRLGTWNSPRMELLLISGYLVIISRLREWRRNEYEGRLIGPVPLPLDVIRAR